MPGLKPTLRMENLEAREVPAVFTVNGLGDGIIPDGELTLREAISLNTGAITFNVLSVYEKAQVSGTIGTNDKIQFSTTGAILLGSDLPMMSKKLTIEGPGANSLTIDGDSQHVPFTVAAAGDVNISKLTVSGGHSATVGGGLLNNGKLTLSQVEFRNNNCGTYGAAIENNGTLIVDQCYFNSNSAQGVAGAIDNNNTATITNSTFQNNSTGTNGGAIWSNGTLVLTNDTFLQNTADSFGGAVRMTGGTTTITSCTITGNRANYDHAGGETGGGISVGGGTLILNNTVVATNLQGLGGGQYADGDVSGLASGQFNFIGVDTGLAGITNGVNNNRVGTTGNTLSPDLANPAMNGGFAPTLQPYPGSPLIGTGAPVALAATIDQIGQIRTDGATTVGAVEVVVPVSLPPVSPPPVPPSPPPGGGGGQPPLKHVDLYAVGADAGGSPHVRVFNVDGSERFSFYAYYPEFTGGVQVATGDVTGDGIDDIVTAAGAGGGPHVKVFDGATGQEIRSCYAYDSAFSGGVSVAVGDVNGDGLADIITGAGPGGGPHVKVFDGATNAESRSFYAYHSGYSGGVRVAAGDLDGDGHADIVVGPGANSDPHVKAFDGVTGAVVRDFFAFTGFTGGVSVAAGDLDGDGKAEIITGAGTGGGPHVKVWSGTGPAETASFYAFDPSFTGGARVSVVDTDGDGKMEVLAAPGSGTAGIVNRFSPAGMLLSSVNAFDSSFLGGAFVG